MSRIRLAEPHEIEPDVVEMIDRVQTATGDTTALRALAHRPDILRAFVRFYWPLQNEGRLDRKLVELVRLAIAQINRCPNCLAARYQDAMAQGLTEDLVAALPGAEGQPEFSAREKAAIAFAQRMARDHWSVGDAEFERLHRHFDTGEIVELNMLVAQFIGIGRMLAVIDATNPQCAFDAASGAAGAVTAGAAGPDR
jgi:uncharacterized peroxidase-related enzyme